MSKFSKGQKARSVKNVQFKRRGKQMEESLRNKKIIEDKYLVKSLSSSVGDIKTCLAQSSILNHEKNEYTSLLTSFARKDSFRCSVSPEQEPISKTQPAIAKNEETNNINSKQSISFPKDVFIQHFQYNMSSETVESLLSSQRQVNSYAVHWPSMGDLKVEIPHITIDEDETATSASIYKDTHVKPAPLTLKDLQKFGFKEKLLQNKELKLTQLQSEMLHILNNYQDLFYSQYRNDVVKEVRQVYCMHILNHVLKSWALIAQNNKKIKNSSVDLKLVDDFSDQGLSRPKVLVIMPFRNSAYDFVMSFIRILYGCKEESPAVNQNVNNFKRFCEEFTGNTLHFPKTNPKPEDYVQTFSGNTDDNFWIGMKISKNSLRLYSSLESSDIIIGSPLGLRLFIQSSGGTDLNYDFLNSIELLVLDQAEIFLAQNWENLLYVFEHLHLQPRSLPEVDMQRVRPWCLSGFSKFYRQTILLTSIDLPEFKALFTRNCWNYRGRVLSAAIIERGDAENIIVPAPQIFRKVNVQSIKTANDERFEYFINKVLPQYKSTNFAHCMIYIPSYLDFVRIRNYFKAESLNFVQICEYTKKEKIARARDIFFHSGAQFLLYSERSHFYRRTRIKGIRHLIMYQLPSFPHFYSELINLMQEVNQNSRDGLASSISVTVLYTKYDQLRMKAILGSDKTKKAITSDKTSHVFICE